MMLHKLTHRHFKKYRTIVVDPPYGSMSMKTLKSLPIDKLAANNSHLYLWTTNALIREAFEVLEAWGFVYKTIITWVRSDGLGPGLYWRDNTEHCLFGVKGRKKVLRNDMRNAIIAQQRKGSGKPPEFMACVEEMSPWPRLDYFGTSKGKRWRVWDNEVKENKQPQND